MLLEQVKRTIDRYRLLDKGDRLIVGVSAGVDSMVLLHLLSAYRQEFDLSLIVAHVNHGLRPEESEKEMELVKKESERLGFTFEYGPFNVKEFQEVGGISLQDAARRIRFHFFNVLLQKYNANKIALGHHADDQVETVLLRLMRGSGLKGLKGMLPIRERRVIRPLLEVWRREIESFAEEMKISYLLDSSNLKKNYLRNQLRLSLIPLIEKEYQPNFKKIVLKTSTVLRKENDYLERETEESYQKIVRKGKDTLSFGFAEYQSLHPAIQWRIIQKMLGRIDTGEMILEEGEWLEVSQIYRKLEHPSPSFLLELPHGVCLEKRYDLVLMKKEWVKQIPPFEIELISPGRTYIEEIEKEVVIEETSRDDKFKDLYGLPYVVLLDYQNLQFPLKIRNFRPGDRFQPLGVKGTQKLKEFFIDHKIPKFERPRIPLLISGEMIAWVVGYRIDERVKITENTQRVLRVKLM
ncbi:MAG: tRNA lysidine(34) synthetase TilS [Desulfobacterales bacterium]|nr:tRNA lysidine(34) synthetase TilS [Desulfobacterales bacterium]